MSTRYRHPERLPQLTVLKTAADLVKKQFGCTVYSDEVLRNFKKPCFFSKMIVTTRPQAKYIVSRSTSIIFTYFPREKEKTEIHYMEIFEAMHMLFVPGFRAGDRYLHVSEVSQDRIGEDEDILQITVSLNYLDYLVRPKSDDMMEDVGLNMKNVHGRNDEEVIMKSVEDK